MKRLIIVTLMSLLLTTTPVMAATTVDTTWFGSGNNEIHFVSGDDAYSDFRTGGSSIAGEFHAKDYDDNPYNYNVDTTNSFIGASVAGSGFLEFRYVRDDSKTSYGNPGQTSYTLITTDDGTAEMAWGVRTNYAEMGNCQYGWVYSGSSPYSPTTSGKQFEASGSSYSIYHALTDGDGDGAWVGSKGSGSAEVKLMGEKATSGFNMGSLPVCGDGCAWDNNYATFSGSGTGQFDLHAWADHGLTVGASCPTCSMSIPGDGTDNSASYDLTVGYAGTWSYSDFGISGN